MIEVERQKDTELMKEKITAEVWEQARKRMKEMIEGREIVVK